MIVKLISSELHSMYRYLKVKVLGSSIRPKSTVQKKMLYQMGIQSKTFGILYSTTTESI